MQSLKKIHAWAQMKVPLFNIFLSISLNICFGWAKEVSHRETSFEYPQHIGLGAKLIYMGYFVSLLHPQGRKTWLLFSVGDMSWGL